MKKCFLILFVLLMFGCKPQMVFVPVNRDSTVYKTKTDSILMYRHDSIFIHTKNDTVFLEKYRTLLVHRDRTDTVRIENMKEIPVPMPKEIREVVLVVADDLCRVFDFPAFEMENKVVFCTFVK